MDVPEGVFSNRRLVFTQEQAYFECRGMVAHESISLPLLLYHAEPDRRRMDTYLLSGVFHGGGDLAYAHQPSSGGFGHPIDDDNLHLECIQQLDMHIEFFTARELTYDEDSLLAFAGIAEKYATFGSLAMLLGLPVWDDKQAETRRATLLRSLALAILFWNRSATRWPPTGAAGRTSTTGLLGAQKGDAEMPWRRRHLPSWT